MVVAIVATSSLIAAPREPKTTPLDVAAEVDRLLAEIWAEAFTSPAAPATPEAFFRRLSLDVRGVIPHADEVERFVADRSPDRVLRWTTWMIETPDYAEHQAETWVHALIGRDGDPDGLDRDGFRLYLRDAFLRNRPYSELVREILSSEGLASDSPGANFFLRYEGRPEDTAGRVARVFLGTRIECAECHDHPYADVKREEFYGFAAFFARTRRYRDEDRAGGDSNRYGVRDAEDGELTMPPMKQGEKPIEVKPVVFGERFDPAKHLTKAPIGDARYAAKARGSSAPSSAEMRDDATRRSARDARSRATRGSRRTQLVEWLTGAENKYFARSLVNRVWAQFLGKGFVNPIDDFSEESKIVLPKVLDYLSRDFVENGYDIARLIRIVVATRAYRQQAVRGVPGGIVPGEDHDIFTSLPIRPLEAEALARSVLRATGLEEPQPEENSRRVREFVAKARRDFSRRFGIDETERRAEFQGTVLQVLLLFNGEFTGGKAPTSRPFHAEYEKKYPGNLDVVLHGVAPTQQIDRLFLSTLSRSPTAAERQTFEQHLFGARDDAARQRALADIQWALLNSAEFVHSG